MTEELNLEEIVEIEPAEISEEQKAFLVENKDTLTDEQREKYDIKEEEKKEEPEINLDEITPETRRQIAEKKKAEADEIEREDEAVISKVVAKKLAEAGVGNTNDQVEVDGYIRDNPEFAKYRAVALKYMKDSSYINLPAKNIMAIVAFKDSQKIGAQKEREAAEKAKNTKGGGSDFRKPTGAKTDWSKATSEEIEAKKAEIYDRR